MGVVPAFLQPFLDYLKFEKRYSQHTLVSYETDLTAFFHYLEAQYGSLELNTISHLYVRSWLATLKEKGLTAKSINRKISSLKSFFKYQLKTGVLEQSPMAKVVSPKTERRLPNFVADRDIDTLFRHVVFPDGYLGGMERMILLLFYHTGIRLNELVNLRISQVNFYTNTLKVLGKGNKERMIPIGIGLREQLQEYIQVRKDHFPGTEEDCLLLSKKGKKLAARAVYDIVRKYLSLVTTIEKRSPHVMRHTFATHLTNNGADLNAVKELLGHSSLAATQVYTHNTIEKLKHIYSKAHPKA
ncbi:MAG TPA: tyrosine-type recombinase/integrase [Flavisolibacter sp.]|jgi:integrase/recombinase XerC|nr:tyrosine-type recombinase/integrase [Flavisolibacter sp.]